AAFPRFPPGEYRAVDLRLEKLALWIGFIAFTLSTICMVLSLALADTLTDSTTLAAAYGPASPYIEPTLAFVGVADRSLGIKGKTDYLSQGMAVHAPLHAFEESPVAAAGRRLFDYPTCAQSAVEFDKEAGPVPVGALIINMNAGLIYWPKEPVEKAAEVLIGLFTLLGGIAIIPMGIVLPIAWSKRR
ncbi:unnamed protein product, partial [Symbiodinium sp. KB8]